MTELDERKAAILRAIVEHYVDSAQPVGSQTVTQTAGLGVSAATVRNEMSVLERDGFIAQPHTSAGRVPTDSGYRYYVDHLAGAGALAARRAPPHRRLLHDRRRWRWTTSSHETSQLLARVTAHAAVVVGPQSESVTVRSVHLALLQPRVVLAVVVMSNGAVEKETVVLDADADADDVGDRERAPRRASRRAAAGRAARDDVSPARAGDRADALATRVVRGARRVRRPAPRRAALRRRREPPGRRAGSVREHERVRAPRAARTARRARRAAARAARSRAHRAHRRRERARRPARVLARARAVPRGGRGRSAPSACSARRAWTTARRRPRCPRCRANSASSSPVESVPDATR